MTIFNIIILYPQGEKALRELKEYENTKENLMQIIDLMIVGVNKTLAGQKITVSVTPEAKILLANLGYDPKLGARPMRRVIQRVVENTIARKMLSGEAQAGSNIEITPEIVRQS
mgnify:CR=1 FL=1